MPFFFQLFLDEQDSLIQKLVWNNTNFTHSANIKKEAQNIKEDQIVFLSLIILL
jgi:hypothetical protein